MSDREHTTAVNTRIIWTPPVHDEEYARDEGDRIDVIKRIRELTGLDLVRCRDIFNSAVPFGAEMIIDIGVPVTGPLPPYLRLAP